ncbi:hypothetical protein Scep_011979 [Stephania cephalantha]|uniref:Protein kinase domain-containing protein n=1 Tax=Stephania cephalantha TaxID=152367 RepID=A0AAP0JFS0_9MAGN
MNVGQHVSSHFYVRPAYHVIGVSLGVSLEVSHPRFIGGNFDRNKILYARAANLAAKYGCTPGQLAKTVAILHHLASSSGQLFPHPRQDRRLRSQRTLSRTMDPCQSAVGTIAYMSPERIDTDLAQGAYDGCVVDIWSFGVSVLELYLGRFPFGASGNWATLMCAICMSRPPEAPSSASPHFRHFVASCLHKDPPPTRLRWSCFAIPSLLVHFLTPPTSRCKFNYNV